MKLLLRTVLFHLLCVFIFAGLYYNYREELYHKFIQDFTFIDYILLSTTIQAGVGISTIFPITFFTKLLMIMQHILMILTHVFTIYIFNV
jgi:hypothetical protein